MSGSSGDKKKISSYLSAHQMVEQWLLEHGYDGLCCVVSGHRLPVCTCFVGNLAPCGGIRSECVPGVKVPGNRGPLLVQPQDKVRHLEELRGLVDALVEAAGYEQQSRGRQGSMVGTLLSYLVRWDDSGLWEYAEGRLKGVLWPENWDRYLESKRKWQSAIETDVDRG